MISPRVSDQTTGGLLGFYYPLLYVCCAEKNMLFFMFVWRAERRLEGNHWIEESLKMAELRVQVVF